MFEIFHKRTLKNGGGGRWPIPALLFPEDFKSMWATVEQKTGPETGDGWSRGPKARELF